MFNYFLSVTDLLFSKINEFLEIAFGAVSSITGAVALICCIVLVINALNTKTIKKFITDNNKFIYTTLILEVVSCLISTNNELIKFNLLTIVISLSIILYKVTAKNKTKKSRVKNEKLI